MDFHTMNLVLNDTVFFQYAKFTELELGQFYDFNSELTIFVRTFIRVFEYSLTKTQKTDFDTHGFWMDRVNFKLSLILNFFHRLIQSMLCMIFEN